MSYDVIEPATEQVLATVRAAGADEVDMAVERARRAQWEWRRASPAERGDALFAIADGIDRAAETLARLESRNVGMAITDARAAVQGAAATFRYYAAAPERLLGSTIPVAGGINMTFREPLGVVGLITPWNFPLSIASWKVAPALAAANGVVLKPAEMTPLTAVQLERIAVEAGLPDGLFNVVLGPGPVVGRRIVDHPGIAKIAFTGSTEVGRAIAAGAAKTIKRVTLELGGKSASIVFADADIESAARGLTGAVFGNAGQDCCARSRVFVERRALEPFLETLSDVVDDLLVGDPLDDATQMGPLISAPQREQVAGYVDDAHVAFQGSTPHGPGYWFPPTVLHPIDDGHRAAREEIFGPVVSVLAFDSEDEVLERANDTIYGLSGSIWTSDGARAIRVARGLEVGALAVNSYTSVRVATPFGGFKQSGVGRELGPDALEAYTEVKNVYFSTGGSA